MTTYLHFAVRTSSLWMKLLSNPNFLSASNLLDYYTYGLSLIIVSPVSDKAKNCVWGLLEEEEVPLTFWKVLGSRRYCSHQLLLLHHHHHAASHMGMPTDNFKIYLSGDFIMMSILRISPLLQNVGAVH